MDITDPQSGNASAVKPVLWRLFVVLVLPTVFILLVITLFFAVRSAMGFDVSSVSVVI